MKICIDETGALKLTPKNDKDKMLIFCLIDCSDLTQFSEYLQLNRVTENDVTTDLDTDLNIIVGYLQKHDAVFDNPTVFPDHLPEKIVNQNRSLIGFCRG